MRWVRCPGRRSAVSSLNIRIAALLALLMVLAVPAFLRSAEGGAVDLTSRAPGDPAASAPPDRMAPSTEARPRPAPLLSGTRLRTRHSLKPLADLLREMSANREWLTPTVRRALEQRQVELFEIFDGIPRFLEVDGAFYRLALVANGSWADEDAARRAVFVIDPDIHVRAAKVLFAGEERLSYESAEALARGPVVTLSIEPANAESRPRGTVTHYPSTLSLGAIRTAGPAEPPVLEAAPAASSVEVLPFCSSGQLACPGNGRAYFYLDELTIFADHEDLGSPEVEAEVYRLDLLAPTHTYYDPAYGIVTFNCRETDPPDIEGPFVCNHIGSSNRFIFDGGSHPDATGATRVYPDVNEKNDPYPIAPAIALFPLFGSFPLSTELSSGQPPGSAEPSGSHGWSINLVDDDREAGVLYLRQEWQVMIV